MTTLRTQKNTNYTTINNTVLNDQSLSWEAKGLAAYLFSKPDDWRINVNQLWGASTNGVGAVKRTLRELEDHGYLRRRRYRNAAGTFEWEQVLYETPQPPAAAGEEDSPLPEEAPAADSTIGRKPSDGFPSDGKPSNGFPSDGNPSHIVSTDHQVLRPSTDHQVLKTTDRPHARAKPSPSSSSSRPGGDAGRSANVSRETRPEPGAAQHRAPSATVTAEDPPSPLAAPPSPSQAPAADAGQLGAVAAALLEQDLCADIDDAGRQASALLGEGFPPEWVIDAALQTAAKRNLRDPIAYVRGMLGNWQREGRRQAHTMGTEAAQAQRWRKFAAEMNQLQPEPVDAGSVSRETPADPVDRRLPVAVATVDEAPELATVAAALERACVPAAETHAAQLVATFGHLQPAQLVATIEAAAAATPGKAPSLMGIRNQLRQLNATEAR